MPIPRNDLTRLLSELDQVIAETESLTVARCDDDTLQGATKALAELRETREKVEGKLRAE